MKVPSQHGNGCAAKVLYIQSNYGRYSEFANQTQQYAISEKDSASVVYSEMSFWRC